MSGQAFAPALLELLFRLGDDRLVLGHRLSEWCGHAPILEEDIALSNIALDCLGHAALLLDEAGRVEGLGRDADRFAFHRDGEAFRNCLLVEQPNGDFAVTIVRQFLVDVHSDILYSRLEESAYEPLAAIAAKVVKEVRYHRRHSSQWLLRLGDGTEESRIRAQAAVDELWKYGAELFRDDETGRAAAHARYAPLASDLRGEWEAAVRAGLEEATLRVPDDHPHILMCGREGRHTEALGHMLSVMQSLPRAHPGASW